MEVQTALPIEAASQVTVMSSPYQSSRARLRTRLFNEDSIICLWEEEGSAKNKFASGICAGCT